MIIQKMYKMKVTMINLRGIRGRSQRTRPFRKDPYETPDLNIKEQCRRQNNAPQRYPYSEAWNSDYVGSTARGHLATDRIKVSNKLT